MDRYIYDIEVMGGNFFCVTFLNVNSKEKHLFAIYDSRNDIDKLEIFVNQPIEIFGYNNLMYDGVVLQYLLQNKNSKTLLQDVFDFSGKLIGSERGVYNNAYRKYQYPENIKYSQIDLMKIIEINGIAPSLKQVAINLQWYKIQDLPFEYNHIVSNDEEAQLIYDYNLNDVLISERLYTRLLPRIELREKLSKLYGINLMSASNSKIADKVLEKYYGDELKADMTKIKTLRTKREQFLLSECIAPNIHFKTRFFNRIKNEIANTLVRKSTNFKYSKGFEFGGVEYEMGVGGLHSVDSPNKFVANDEWHIYDLDVASFYPSMMIHNHIVPEHLGKDFTLVLEKLTKERLSAKKTDKIKAEALKVTINSIFGKLGSETFWLQDEKALRSVTVSGQLYLFMLIEELVLNGIQVISANTDGVVSRVHKSQEELFTKIFTWWQNETGFILEKTEYELYFRQDVNNYITKKANGEIKSKGRYVKEIGVEKGYKSPIVPIAMYEFVINNKPVEQTIKECKNILDFCISQKSNRDFQLEYHLSETEIENLQRNNRFFISLDGGTLNKHHKEKGNNIGLMVGKKVRILNDYDSNVDISSYDIDYDYYIEEARKYTNEINLFEKQFEPFVDEDKDYTPPQNIKEREEFFFQFHMIKNLSENFVDDLLWLKDNFKGNNFFDFLVFATDNKKLSSKITAMIKLNYFKEYGNQKKLLLFIEEFTKGKNKYTLNLTQKSKDKRLQALNDFWNWMPEQDFTVWEQIQNEVSVIGQPYSVYDVNSRYAFVKKIDNKSPYHPKIKLIKLSDGSEKELKVKQDTLIEFPFSEGDIILCKSFEKKFRRIRGEDGKLKDTDVFDIFVSTYYKMKTTDKFLPPEIKTKKET